MYQRKPKLRAYTSGNQTINTGTFTKVAFDTIGRDTHGFFNTGTNRYTPLVAGTYNVKSQIYFNSNVSAGCFYYVSIYKNGALLSNGLVNISTISGSFTVTIDDDVDMNGTTDYVEIFVWQNNAATQTVIAGAGYTWLSANLID